MPGHAAGYRVDRELNLTTVLFQGLGQLAYRVLGLSNRHAITGRKDHRFRGFQD